MSSPIRVVRVDDHEVFVDALALCLGDHPDLVVTGAATSLDHAMRLVDDVDFDVLVLDLNLAGVDGLEVARHVLRTRPRVGILVATGADSDSRVVEAVQLGVRGWLPKTVTANALADAIRGVARGETCIPADLLAQVLVGMSRGAQPQLENVQGITDLTSRELEVLSCLVEGLTRTEIGDLLHVSPNTVRTHVQSILHKLKVHSALAAVAIARRAGITGTRLTA